VSRPTTVPAGPGVHLPPPLLFVAAVGGGIMLDRALPLPVLPEGWRIVNVVAGWTLLAPGLVVALWALFTFFAARTAVMPNRPARRLVTTGPYRWSRNPMYLSLTMQGAGLALLVNSLWPLLLLPVAVAILIAGIIRREESYLSRAFGEEYAAYRARVGRWL